MNALAPPSPPAGPSSFTSTIPTLIPARPNKGFVAVFPSSRTKRLGTGGVMVCPRAAAMACPSLLDPVARRMQAQGRASASVLLLEEGRSMVTLSPLSSASAVIALLCVVGVGCVWRTAA